MSISPAYQEIVDFIAAGTTPQNEVTSRILNFNHIDRLIECEELAVLGYYP